MNWKFWQSKEKRENEEIKMLQNCYVDLELRYRISISDNEDWIRKLIESERDVKNLQAELKKERMKSAMLEQPNRIEFSGNAQAVATK